MIKHLAGASFSIWFVSAITCCGMPRTAAGEERVPPPGTTLIDDRVSGTSLTANLDQWFANPTSTVGRAAFKRIIGDRGNLETLRRLRPGLPVVRQYQATVLIAALMTPPELVQALTDVQFDAVELRIISHDLLGRAVTTAAGESFAGVAPEDIRAAAIRLASNRDWRVRVCAGRLFEAAGGAAVDPALERLLGAGEWPVRSSAIAALGAVSPAVAAPRIRTLYAASDACRLDDRQALVRAMAHAGSWPDVLACLDDDEPSIRVAAAQALAQAPELPADIRQLLPKLADTSSDEYARRELQQLIRRLDDESRDGRPPR